MRLYAMDRSPYLRGLVWLTLLLASTVAAQPAKRSQHEVELDVLFDRLQNAQSIAEAQAVEGLIWRRWTTHSNPAINRLMQKGIASITQGHYKRALALFDRMVAQAPGYAEAWNKRATVHYLRGDHAASLADIQRALDLEGRHFGALSGLGLIFTAQEQYERARQAFEAILEVYPIHPQARDHLHALEQQLSKTRQALAPSRARSTRTSPSVPPAEA